MAEQNTKIILLLSACLILSATAFLYWLGFFQSTGPRAPVVILTPTTTSPVATPIKEASTSTPVVVPAEELNIIPTKPIKKHCIKSGCGGEICSDKEMMSTCMYRPEFACYKGASCEVQASGECGWTKSAELTQCLMQNQDSPNIIQ